MYYYQITLKRPSLSVVSGPQNVLRDIQGCLIRHYFFLIDSVKLLQSLHLLQKLSLQYYYSNVFPQTHQKLLVLIVEDKLEETISDGIRGDVQLGGFILLSVPVSQQLLRLTSLYIFSLLKRPLNLDCIFR